jgi:hypothetical protein
MNTAIEEAIRAEHKMGNSPVIRGVGYIRCTCGQLTKGAYSQRAHESHVLEVLAASNS